MWQAHPGHPGLAMTTHRHRTGWPWLRLLLASCKCWSRPCCVLMLHIACEGLMQGGRLWSQGEAFSC